jgi:bacterial/archaeal transporter family-2 protein
VDKWIAALLAAGAGTILLLAICLTVGGGLGDAGRAGDLPWYYLIGGVLGAAYVTTALVTVRELGAGGLTGATIAGQLTMAVILDRAGAFGLPEKAVSVPRVIGVALLATGVFLIVRE